jgi:hypothetical protein
MPNSEELRYVCGLPIEGELNEFPLAALVVVKCLVEDGVTYQARATDGLSTVEAMGMAELAVLRLREALKDE